MTVDLKVSEDSPVDGASLVGYAILRANFDSGRPNYLDNFLEFVVDAARVRHPAPVTAEDTSRWVKEKYGISIPPLVAGRILKRAQHLGRLHESTRAKFGCSSEEMSSGRSVAADYDRFIRQENQVADRLITYATESRLAERETMNREVAAALIAKYMDSHALPLLRNAVQGANPPVRLDPGDQYLMSCFVADACERDEDLFGRLVEIAKGATLAAVLQMDVSSLQASLRSLTVYIDAPIVLDLLGHHGETAESASTDLLELARELGATVAVFSHTVREAKSILSAAQTQLRTGQRVDGTFRAAVYFLEGGMGPSDIEIAIQQLESKLKLIGVREYEKPDTYHEYGLDESVLQETIQRAIHYANDAALRYDVDSISAVHRLREGRPGETLERARAIFVTANRELVGAANKSREDSHEFPLALLDSTLASLLWVRRPSMAEDLPAKKVAATAWAGMQPDAGRWSQYLAEVDRLEERGSLSREDAIILRLSSESKRELMREARGEPDQFASIPPTALVERVKEVVAEPLREQIKEMEAQAEQEADSHAAEINSARQEAADAKLIATDLHRRLAAAEAANRTASEEEAARRVRLYHRADRDAQRAITMAIWIIGVVTLLAGVVPLIAPTLGWDLPKPWPLILSGCGLAVIIVGLLTQVIGGSVREWLGRARRPLALWLHRRRLEVQGMMPGLEAEPAASPQSLDRSVTPGAFIDH